MNFTENVTQLKFSILAKDKKLLTFTYDNRYGVIIKRPGSEPEYLDIDLQLSPKQRLFLTTYKDKVHISVGGLTYVDMIYGGHLSEQRLALEFDWPFTSTQP